MKHGKKYLESAKLIESSKLYDPDEAVKLALQTAKTKFDETMEISVRLGVDPRQADQQVRGAVVLRPRPEGPHAEPEERHRHHGCGEGHQRDQGW